MKHLKSSFRDLRQIIEQMTVRYLAEPFMSFDNLRAVDEVKQFMVDKDFDVVGVRDNGGVIGYVKRTELDVGILDNHLICFPASLILEESAPLREGLKILKDTDFVFVRALGHVSGIFTKGDLQKAPVRMWIFGVLSLLEMQFLRLIRDFYTDNSWEKLISRKRRDNVEKLFQYRRQENVAIDLADCLQFADKRTIILKNGQLWSSLGFKSRAEAKCILKGLERLRDRLAHAQDIITGQWPHLADLTIAAEELLSKAERLSLP